MKNEILKVGGMTCNHCVNTIQKALSLIGVKSKVDLKKQTVEVEYDDKKYKIDDLKKIISENGYDV